MKKRINKISDFFKVEKLRNDRQLVIFLICLFIATGLWFLNAMSKNYTTSITYPVIYVNAPDNQFLSNVPPTRLELKVNARGFTLLRHKLSLTFSPLVLNLTSMTENQVPVAGLYSISTRTLLRRISSQVSREMALSEIQPEIIQLRLDSLKTKTVPVKTDFDLEFKPQFNLNGRIKVTPDSVTLTGPAGVISGINHVIPVKKSFGILDKDVIRIMDIEHPENTTAEPDKVQVTVAVDKFTEKELKIPVQLRNNPGEANIKLFPSEVKLIFLVGLSEFENITPDDFTATADFSQVNESTEHLQVRLDSMPEGIELVRISPETVEFLIETN